MGVRLTKPIVMTNPEDIAGSPSDLANGVIQMRAAGLSWIQILTLFWKYGPLVTQIANTVIEALRSEGGLTIGLITRLIQQYGEQVQTMVKEMLALIGVNYPT